MAVVKLTLVRQWTKKVPYNKQHYLYIHYKCFSACMNVHVYVHVYISRGGSMQPSVVLMAVYIQLQAVETSV